MGLKTPKLNESELLELLRRQDRKAFNYLYDNYSDALYGVILEALWIEQPAQDLL